MSKPNNIGITKSKNSNKPKKETVNLLINESVNLPISFIVGMSFISGSLTGGLLKLNFLPEKKEKL